MSIELEKIYSLWKREMMRFFRERSRIITSVVTPLLWIMIFGSGLRGGGGMGGMGGGSSAGAIPGGDYRAFIFPGIVGMSLLFNSMFTGISVIWERQFGILRAVLVAPVSRVSIIMGKALGGATGSMIQGVILLAFAPLVRVGLSPLKVIELLPVMYLIALGIVGIGLLIAAFMESLEGFNLIMSFAIMPMFFLSGALFPLSNAPAWLQKLAYIDPLTYGVDALRAILMSDYHPFMPIYVSTGVLIGFVTLMITLSTLAFGIKK